MQEQHENLEERHEKEVADKLALLADVKGLKAKRVAIKREKILKDNQLYEEAPDDEQGEDDDFIDHHIDNQSDNSDKEGRLGEGGLYYASETSGEDMIIDEEGFERPKRLFIPRCKVQAYKQGEGKVLKQRQGNPLKFTKGTDPKSIDLIKFLVDDSIACPQFLPLDEEDAQISATVMEAIIHQEDVPISEFIKKEVFFKSYQSFEQAIAAEPALIKLEIQNRFSQLDALYGLYKNERERQQDMRFTQGDYRRFCCLFYLMTRRWLKQTEFLMERERKKRMMPRHLLTAAVIQGLVPLMHIPKHQMSQQDMVKLEQMMAKKPTAPRVKAATQIARAAPNRGNGGQANNRGKVNNMPGRGGPK